jgi:hypothetical protein
MAKKHIKDTLREAHAPDASNGEGAYDETPSRYDRVTGTSATYAWTFPLLMAVAVVAIVWTVLYSLDLWPGPVGDALSARLTWGVSCTLFASAFVFALVQCHILMFRCGQPDDAMAAAALTTGGGVLAVLWMALNNDIYLGPAKMKQLLDATAFTLHGVRVLSSICDGLAVWAGLLVLATSCVILRRETDEPKELSRQLRASRILLNVGSALLITGVSQSAALHRWPVHDAERAAACCPAMLPSATDAGKLSAFQKDVQTTALAISTTVGTACSLVLVAAYMPLGVLLRQRAYAVITPWERTEAWLAMHGMSLQPMQQLGKVLLMLAPLLAGGPVTYLLNLISR